MQFPDVPIHIIDFEGSLSYGIVEFGIVTVKDGSISEFQTQLCRAEKKISWQDQRQHGLDNKQVESFPLFSEYWKLFSDLRKNGVLAAHNASVENNLLKRYWAYPRLSIDPRFSEKQVASWGPWADTLTIYRRIYPGLDSYKLMDLISVFQLEAELKNFSENYCPESRRKSHCALFDAVATALLLSRLKPLDVPSLMGFL